MKEHKISKFEDERGWMVNLIEKGFLDKERIKNIHLGTITPGQIRGNHFHEKQKEWLFVLVGRQKL